MASRRNLDSALDIPLTKAQIEAEAAPVELEAWPEAPTQEQLATEARVPRFAALAHRNFRLFWTGNAISLVGTRAQFTALGWLVRTLTPDPQAIAFVAACGSMPILLLSFFPGVVTDRIDKRKGLLATNSVAALLALVLAWLTWQGHVRVWQVALVSLGVGVVNAFDGPIRQAFTVDMVGREALPNAIALNASAFNAARVAGPAVGGFLLHEVGMGDCFLLNAISFAGLLVGLCMMRLPAHVKSQHSVKKGDFLKGLVFVRGHERLSKLMLLIAAISFFTMSFVTLLPIFARDVFGGDDRGFAALLTCNGLGAMGAAVSLSVTGTIRHNGKRLLIGAFLFCLSVMAFACCPTLPLACGLLILSGWCLLTFLMTANTMVHLFATDALRGRIFALYSLALIGASPMGSLLVGSMAKWLGPREAVFLGGLVGAVITLYVFLTARSLWKEK